VSYGYSKRTSPDDHGEVEIFEAYLRQSGLKLTKARRDLLNLVFSNHQHFTAEELCDQCKAQKLRVSKATVYRTLSILLECNLLTAHDFGEGSKYYEHIYGHRHHDHFFCLVCKRIAEFRSESIEALQDEAAQEMGFMPIRHTLSIFGVCRVCAETPEGRRFLEQRERAPGAVAQESTG
jgi:Fur family transcriptional regulator, ferric uptake regulator